MRLDRWLQIGVFVYGLAVVVPLLSAEIEPAEGDAILARSGDTARARLARNVASLYYDDSFYYLQIARHAAAGSGSTFDGAHPTNGYHPLWLLCLIPLARWIPGAESLLLASFVCQALAAAVTAVLVYRIALRFSSPLSATIAAAVWIRLQSTYWTSWAGMEYGVQALAVASLLYAYLRLADAAAPPDRRRFLGLGILASLAFLARLDNLLLAALVGLALVRRRSSVQGLVAYAAPVILTVAAYAGLNLWLFDGPWPVSAELKRVWSAELLAADPIYLSHGWLGAKAATMVAPLSHLSRSFAAGLLFGAAGGAVLTALAAARRRARYLELWPLAAFAALQYLAYAVVYHGGFSFQPWYFVAQLLLAALLAAAAVDAAWKRAAATSVSRLRPLAAALLLAALLLSTVAVTERRRERLRGFGDEPLYAAAGWIRADLPSDANVGAWNAGILAFFSDRRVINLDGLVNSRAFLLQHRHDLCAYLDRQGVDYVVDVLDAERPFAQYASQIGHCVSRLDEIWTGPGYPGSSPPRRAAAFRWREPSP